MEQNAQLEEVLPPTGKSGMSRALRCPHADAPIRAVAADDHLIGALCALEFHIRELEARQKDTLRSLAHKAATERELRRDLEKERNARRSAERLLREKEDIVVHNDVLMREIDHRVKNSLQFVSSALLLQARRSTNDDAKQSLEEARNRICAVAAVHQQLSHLSASGWVDLSQFLDALCRALVANKPNNIDNVISDLAQVTVEPQRAMKIGVLVAELMINAFKHAYACNEHGDVRIRLDCVDHTCRLVVEDDGRGMPESPEDDGQKGFGLRLVRLTASQLGGTLSCSITRGTKFVINIPHITVSKSRLSG